MTMSGSLLSALDAVLDRAKDLLLDFDGVVVRLYQADARARTAAWLQARLADPETGYHRLAPRLADPAAMLCTCEVEGASGRVLADEDPRHSVPPRSRRTPMAAGQPAHHHYPGSSGALAPHPPVILTGQLLELAEP